MIVYEVNLTVEVSIAEKYLEWLPKHIQHMLALPGFVSAELFDSNLDESFRTYSVQYRLDSEESLENYLMTEAPRMRQAAIDLFGDKFTATRRILKPLEKMSRLL